jgi:hypothetical protein
MSVETTQIGSEDIPIYDKASLPDNGQLVLLTEEPDFDLGGQMVAAYRLPLSRVVPSAQNQTTTYSLADADAGIVIPDGEVVPAYIESFGTYDTKRAIASAGVSKAKFIITGADQNITGNYIIQSDGFYSFPTVHGYDIGATYYLSDVTPGAVTTIAPTIAQPIFTVIDQKTILVRIGE